MFDFYHYLTSHSWWSSTIQVCFRQQWLSFIQVVENQYAWIWSLIFLLDDLNSLYVIPVTEAEILYGPTTLVHVNICWIATGCYGRVDLYWLPSTFNLPFFYVYTHIYSISRNDIVSNYYPITKEKVKTSTYYITDTVLHSWTHVILVTTQGRYSFETQRFNELLKAIQLIHGGTRLLIGVVWRNKNHP